jgi:hypothetical protein
MKPKLKPPGTKRLRLKHDGLLSNFGFKFNLGRYTTEVSQFEWRLPYDQYCSGVLLAHKSFFRGVG